MTYKKLRQFFLILMIFTSWVFSGWLQILGFPPRVQKAYAATLSYVGTAEASGGSASYNVDLSGLSLQQGDLVVVSTGFVSTANGDPGVSTSGYTEVADLYGNDTRDANFSVNWKIMGASPDSSVTCLGSGSATNGAVCIVHVWRGADQTTPMDATDVEATGTNASNPNSGSITPVTIGAIVISTGLGTHAAIDNAVTAPTGYGNQADISVDPGNAATVGISSKAWSSGAEDPAAWTNFTTSTSDSWAAVTLAIRPASAYNQSAYRLFSNANSTDVGSALAVQDTAGTLSSTGDAFRLRMLIHQTDGRTEVSGQTFKLQFAEKSGTCDTGFSGESYADVTGSTLVAYNNNATPADGDNLTANASDPTHSGHTVVNQDYEEANNFTNTVAAVPSGQDGKWDFALIDNGATADTSYCFRVVKSDGAQLDTYTTIPEVIMASGGASGTLTFSISDNTIEFGALTSSDDTFADNSGGNATEVEAHTIAASTNASSGYVITVNGTTLTSGSNTISAIGSSNTSSSAGSEQFGLRMTASGGNGSVTSPYAASGFAFDTGSFPDQVASDADGDDVTTTYSVRYLGNIGGTTEAGNYSATLTYVITAGF